jgi:polyhydroxyalkanoate synthase
MSEQEGRAAAVPSDATPGEDRSEAWDRLFARSQRLLQSWQHQAKDEDGFAILHPALALQTFLTVAQQLFAHPARLQAAQASLAEDYARLWKAIAVASETKKLEAVIEPARDDRRFKDAEWSENPVFDAIKQYYLLTSRWWERLIDEAPGLDPRVRRRAQFYMRQLMSAMAPTNFVVTNPKVLKVTLESGGSNLLTGLNRMLDNMEENNGRLTIPLADAKAFELGRNLASTPGKVVSQTRLAQLIQYTPTTERVFRRPLLIVPPWINKYYVLDLQPKNSFIRWAVAQGHTVFVLSWVNPDATLADRSFEDYIADGPLAALDAIAEITGERQVNAVGYCIGGTLLTCTLAHLAAKGDERFASATLFTTMVDFSDPGELGVFIDDEQIQALEAHMEKKGYLEGAHMAQVFNLLRENDLIWSAFINNYLLAREPPPFDMLYWNADATRMPAMMHKFYLREMYLNNRLVQPDALTLLGTPIDLKRIRTPAYILSARDDHIAPWRSTFAATQLFSGPVRFVLAASGHIAGVINPPTANKYGYWLHARKTKTPDAWFAGATRHEGSWWPDWQEWVARFGGDLVAARDPANGPRPPLEDAPGSYVRVRSLT